MADESSSWRLGEVIAATSDIFCADLVYTTWFTTETKAFVLAPRGFPYRVLCFYHGQSNEMSIACLPA